MKFHKFPLAIDCLVILCLATGCYSLLQPSNQHNKQDGVKRVYVREGVDDVNPVIGKEEASNGNHVEDDEDIVDHTAGGTETSDLIKNVEEQLNKEDNIEMLDNDDIDDEVLVRVKRSPDPVPRRSSRSSSYRSYRASSYRAPSYRASSYRAPSYRAPSTYRSYRAPSYRTPFYRAPSTYRSYRAPSYRAPSYRAPVYRTYRAPSYRAYDSRLYRYSGMSYRHRRLRFRTNIIIIGTGYGYFNYNYGMYTYYNVYSRQTIQVNNCSEYGHVIDKEIFTPNTTTTNATWGKPSVFEDPCGKEDPNSRASQLMRSAKDHGIVIVTGVLSFTVAVLYYRWT